MRAWAGVPFRISVSKRRFIASVLLGLVVLLASCGGPKDTVVPEAGLPRVFLKVRQPDGWSTAVSGMLLSTRPEFEINATASSANNPISRVEYRVNKGNWVSTQEVSQKIRLEPGVQFASGQFPAGPHSVEVRATDRSGNEATAAATFIVDAMPPAWNSFQLGGIEALGLDAPTVTVLLGNASSILPVEARLSDDNDDADIRTVLLDAQGETAATGTGASFSSVLDMATYGEGSHRFTLTAVDAVGNRTEDLVFNVRVVANNNDALPQVKIASPQDGSTFAIGSAIEVILSVEGGDIGFESAHVLVADSELQRAAGPVERFTGRLPTTPGAYTVVAWTVIDGTYELVADYITITVVNDVPVVEITSPAEDRRAFAPERAFDVGIELDSAAANTVGWRLAGTLVPLNAEDGASMVALEQTSARSLAGITPAEAGRYELRVWAEGPVDSSVNLRSAAATMDIWVDTEPPVVQIVNPPHGATLLYGVFGGSPQPPLPPHDVEIQFSDYASPIDRILVESNVAGGWVKVISLNADELEDSHTVTRKWNPQPGGNILRATAWDRFGNTSVSEIVPVFLTSDPDVGGPEVALALPASGQATVTRGEDFTFHFRLNTRFNQDGTAPGQLLGDPEFWLNSDLLDFAEFRRETESDWGGTFANSRERRYTWTVPADLEPGEHVLFIRAHGRSGGTNDSYGVRSLAIVLNVE